MAKHHKFKITKKKALIMSIILAIVVIGIIVAIVLINKNDTKVVKKKTEKVKEVKKLQIVDEDSKTRPYAIMVNNINVARGVQSGLSQAYIVYEIIVEGGITRYLALFKDANVDRIGSIRSSRHYYLDYVLENDAIYIHWGQSPQAKADFGTLGIDRITDNMDYFFRDYSLNVSSEHTLFTTTEKLDQAVIDKNIRKDTDKGLLLNYNVDSVDLSKYGEVSTATNVTLKYSNYITNNYQYNEETKKYDRYVNGDIQVDHGNDENLTVKNIIVYQVANNTIAGDEKGRQEISNIGSGSGYYITEGKAIAINWSKSSRSAKTVYTFPNGEELEVNDGNTFIQIMPTYGNITME